jgi:hypothetical protein
MSLFTRTTTCPDLRAAVSISFAVIRLQAEAIGHVRRSGRILQTRDSLTEESFRFLIFQAHSPHVNGLSFESIKHFIVHCSGSQSN